VVTWARLVIDDSRVLKQALYWEVDTTKLKAGRLRKNWMNIIRQDVKGLELMWEEVQQLSVREAWR